MLLAVHDLLDRRKGPRTIGRMPTPHAEDPSTEFERVARCVDDAALTIAEHLDDVALPPTPPESDRAVLDQILVDLRELSLGRSLGLEDLVLAAVALLGGVRVDPSNLLAMHSVVDLEAAGLRLVQELAR